MDSQHFILGEEVASLEAEIARILQTSFAVGCGSGSDALFLALLALGIGPGDEVITTPFTFVATAGSIARVGAKPVFVDIEPETFNIDPTRIPAAITRHTRAIMPVHLFGLPANYSRMSQISGEFGLPVIEDAAQAIGASYNHALVGGLGTMGCFSFFPSKNLGCAGDGGLVTTNDFALAEKIRLLRTHGSRKKYHYETLGINSRLDALQAAILRVKLLHLPEWTQARQKRAERYSKLFLEYGLADHVKLPSSPPNCVHVYNQFVIRCPQRDALREFLRQRGIPTEVYYPLPLHLQAAFAYLSYSSGQFPQSEKASTQVIALPIYPELTEEEQTTVVHSISDYYRKK